MNEVEAMVYETRRMLAAFVGSSQPLPPVIRPLLGGVMVAATLLGIHVGRSLW